MIQSLMLIDLVMHVVLRIVDHNSHGKNILTWNLKNCCSFQCNTLVHT